MPSAQQVGDMGVLRAYLQAFFWLLYRFCLALISSGRKVALEPALWRLAGSGSARRRFSKSPGRSDHTGQVQQNASGGRGPGVGRGLARQLMVGARWALCTTIQCDTAPVWRTAGGWLASQRAGLQRVAVFTDSAR